MPTNISGTTGIDKVQDGTIVDADIDTVAASKLTGALPAISGANLTNVPAANITGTLPAISGANLTSVNAVNGGRKNLIINGAMKVAQRDTSVTSQTTGGYTTLDRCKTWLSVLGTWTLSKDTNSPEEFSSSWKFDCTTADTSIAAAGYFVVGTTIEGQDLQHLKYGTSAAQSVTLSFWVKSSKTGTYMCELFQEATSGKNSITYTINSANTWEKKSMTFAGVTGTAITDDNTTGLRVYWVLAAGSDRTSGTHSNNTWHTTNANRYPGIVNLADSTSNTFYMTGAQLEVGSTATDFEHRSYGEELALCQRYFEKSFNDGVAPANGSSSTTTASDDGMAAGLGSNNSGVGGSVDYKVTKRINPTITKYGNNAGGWYYTPPTSQSSGSWSTNSGYLHHSGVKGFNFNQNISGDTLYIMYGHWTADAEL